VVVGDLIALIVEPGEDWKNVTIPAGAAAPAAAPVTEAPSVGGDAPVSPMPAPS